MKQVAIVGVEGSGKPVMLSGMGELYTRPDADGSEVALPPGDRAGATTTLTLPGGAKLEMVYCPPGKFLMGDDACDELADMWKHLVTLTKGFWIGKYPVTQAQWQSVMGGNPSSFKGADLPVEQVSWNDCQEFCKKAGLRLRLPTEAEWEYAYRAGTGCDYVGNLNKMAWYENNSRGKTHPVGTKKANPWGIYDMQGNVLEWCEDWYDDYPSDGVTDPTGPADGFTRVFRGGSWDCDAWSCAAGWRHEDDPDFRGNTLGFRLALSQD